MVPQPSALKFLVSHGIPTLSYPCSAPVTNAKKTAKFSNSSSALATKSEKPPQFLDTGSARAQVSSIRQHQRPKKSPLNMTFKGRPQSQDLHVQNSDLHVSGSNKLQGQNKSHINLKSTGKTKGKDKPSHSKSSFEPETQKPGTVMFPVSCKGQPIFRGEGRA